MKQVPVLRLPVEDVDRRLLRQILNKLRGEHLPLGDAQEFQLIISENREEDLKSLLAMSTTEIERIVSLLDERTDDEELNQLPETSIQIGDSFKLGSHILHCCDSLTELIPSAELVFADPLYGMAIPEKTLHEWTEKANTVIIMNSDKEASKYAAHPNFRYFIVGTRSYAISSTTHMPLMHHTLLAVLQEKVRFNPLTPPFTTIIDDISKAGAYEKRLHFYQKLLHAYTNRDDTVVDPFIGHGNMLIACEKYRRRCVAYDLAPDCCQATINKWQTLTSRKAQPLPRGSSFAAQS